MATAGRVLACDTDGSLVAFLAAMGAARQRHSGATFLDHLLGVARLLERWGASPATCKAGLFHSIYGTEYFGKAVLTFDDRPRVATLLGDEAERLVHAFCAFERASLGRAIERGAPYVLALRAGGSLEVSADEIRDLARLVWANALEQARRKPELGSDDRLRARRAIDQCAAHLPEIARSDLAECYGHLRARGATMPTPGLCTLFNLESPGEFIDRYWPNEMFTARGPVERLEGLVDYSFDDLVKMKRRRTQAFFRTVDGKSTSVDVAAGQERPLYEAGFTIYFHNISHPRMAEWVDALDRELGLVQGATRVSAFASRRGAGLKPHYDMNDNFVCQARGAKRWRVARNTQVKNPTAGYTVGAKMLPVHRIEAPRGMPEDLPEPFETVELQPGTVVFMPRGLWHDTETVDQESLHFNVQSGLAMWKDAIEYLLTQTSLLHSEELREPIMHMFDGNGLREGLGDEIKARFRKVFEQVIEKDLDIQRGAFHKFVTSRRPRNE